MFAFALPCALAPPLGRRYPHAPNRTSGTVTHVRRGSHRALAIHRQLIEVHRNHAQSRNQCQFMYERHKKKGRNSAAVPEQMQLLR